VNKYHHSNGYFEFAAVEFSAKPFPKSSDNVLRRYLRHVYLDLQRGRDWPQTWSAINDSVEKPQGAFARQNARSFQTSCNIHGQLLSKR